MEVLYTIVRFTLLITQVTNNSNRISIHGVDEVENYHMREEEKSDHYLYTRSNPIDFIYIGDFMLILGSDYRKKRDFHDNKIMSMARKDESMKYLMCLDHDRLQEEYFDRLVGEYDIFSIDEDKFKGDLKNTVLKLLVQRKTVVMVGLDWEKRNTHSCESRSLARYTNKIVLMKDGNN